MLNINKIKKKKKMTHSLMRLLALRDMMINEINSTYSASIHLVEINKNESAACE